MASVRARESVVIPDGVYMITNVQLKGQVLDVSESGKTDGTNVIVWPLHAKENQKWLIEKCENNWYRVKSVCSNKVLDVMSSQTNANVYKDNGTKAQRWRFLKTNEKGVVKILSALRDGGEMLDVCADDHKNVEIRAENARESQLWQLIPLNGYVKNVLELGETLYRGERLISQNGRYKAVMQEDGNFVLYDNSTALWSSNTYGPSDRIVMQTDGNLVVYAGERPTWASNTYGRGFRLVVQDDANLVVYDANKRSNWTSNTFQR